jgi:hypothetical protein
LTVFMFTVLIGVAAFSTDVGSWYTTQRKLQGAADAAALAGAQDLPVTGTAGSTATSYVNTNISGADAWSPTFAADSSWIDVALTKKAPSFLAKVFGIDSVTVHAHARAGVGTPGSIFGAVPIAVTKTKVCASGSSGCFNVQQTLNYDPLNVTGSKFGLIDLAGNNPDQKKCTSSSSANTLKTWITVGNPALLSINNWYCVATNGEDNTIGNAIESTIGSTKPLLVPVYDTIDPTGGTSGKGSFHIIGWAAMAVDQVVNWHPSNSSCAPNCKVLIVRFVEYIIHDVVSTPGFGGGFGVKVVTLSQ